MDAKLQQDQFDKWMADHIAILYRTVNGFTDGDDRKDLLQEVMLAVWKAMPSFRQQSKPSTFIYRVAHNAALTWKRSRQNYSRKLEQYETQLPAVMHAPPQGSDSELLELLYAEIRKLAPADRSLALLFLDDVSYREMAEIHGLTESNVGVRLNRLKQKLSQSMKEATHGH